MKVLITGGAGFIGKALAKTLRLKNHDVRVMDIMNSSAPGVESFTGSVLDKYAVLDAVDGCDAIVHLAAMLGVQKTDDRPLQCLNINIQGSTNVPS